MIESIIITFISVIVRTDRVSKPNTLQIGVSLPESYMKETFFPKSNQSEAHSKRTIPASVWWVSTH